MLVIRLKSQEARDKKVKGRKYQKKAAGYKYKIKTKFKIKDIREEREEREGQEKCGLIFHHLWR